MRVKDGPPTDPWMSTQLEPMLSIEQPSRPTLSHDERAPFAKVLLEMEQDQTNIAAGTGCCSSDDPKLESDESRSFDRVDNMREGFSQSTRHIVQGTLPSHVPLDSQG